MHVDPRRIVSLALLSIIIFASSTGSLAQAKQVHPKAGAPHSPQPAPGQTDLQPPATQPAATQPAKPQADAPLPAAFRNIFYQPNALAQGSPALFTVEMSKPASRLTGRFLDKEVSFFRGDKTTVWYALAGVDLETAPGSYDLSLAAVVTGKGLVKAVKKIEVAAGDFKTGAIDVPENFVTPDAAAKRQILADTALKAHAYAHSLPLPQWSGDFRKPVDAPSTPSFGMTRVLNEEMMSRHRGTDYPSKEGSSVSSSNAGTVVLAKEMFYEGNCIILDHGQHLFTIYMHLSRMDVKVGEKVKKGAPLGLSGATGRVTGPHLHMGVRWNGASLDPTKLLALTLPETGADVGAKPDAKPDAKSVHNTHTPRRRR